MRPATSLSRRIGLGLLGYALLLGVAVLVHGLIVNETVERLVWRSLLDAEMDHMLARRGADPSFAWSDTETLQLFEFDRGAAPDDPLSRLPPGVHDEVAYRGRELAVNVRDLDGHRMVLALDISDLEAQERELSSILVLSALGLVALLALAAAWGVRRLVRPLGELARRIARLAPEASGHRVELPAGSTVELAVIADAINAYLARAEAFVERERAFVDSASHELRTPIAVMGGAAEIALGHPDVPRGVADQLHRIRHAAHGVEQLVALLLLLAKAPERLAAMSDRVALDQLLPEIVEDHRHLCEGKSLRLELDPPPACDIVAPLMIVQAAIGNLLRNAIENSDSGVVRIALEAEGPVVRIEDPGHGMSPEEISRLYREHARGGGGGRSGIGLALIARLCEHLGWSLAIEPRNGKGTRVRLDLGTAGAAAPA